MEVANVNGVNTNPNRVNNPLTINSKGILEVDTATEPISKDMAFVVPVFSNVSGTAQRVTGMAKIILCTQAGV